MVAMAVPQNLQVAEWEELMALEEEEFKELEKKHGIEIKRLNSNLRWGKYVSHKGEGALRGVLGFGLTNAALFKKAGRVSYRRPLQHMAPAWRCKL